MQELVKRLRNFAEYEADLADESKWERIEWEAADLIESQAAEIAKLREERAKAVAHFPTLVAEARDKSGSCIICGFHPEMAAMWCDDYLKLKSLLENKHE